MNPAADDMNAMRTQTIHRQFLLLLQGDHNIAMALTQSALQQQELQIRKMKQQHMRTSMSVACRARKAGQQQLAQQRLVLDRQLCLQMASSLCASVTTQSQLLGMVVILLQHMSAAQQQLGASLCTQERLQNDALKLKRALAEAQQRKQAAETKVKTLKQEGKALAVALKTVASMLVDKSEQKAHLSASVSCVVEQCASASQLLQAQQAQQPPTPSIASTSSSRPPSLQAPGTHAALADHNPVTQDLPGLTDQDTISDAQDCGLEDDSAVQLLSPSCSSIASNQAPAPAAANPAIRSSSACTQAQASSSVGLPRHTRHDAGNNQQDGGVSSRPPHGATASSKQHCSRPSSRAGSTDACPSTGTSGDRPRWR